MPKSLIYCGVVCAMFTSTLPVASDDNKRPAAILANDEQLEHVAHLSGSGALGCGIGSFLYTDHASEKRRVACGLDPIHVFGHEISAKTLSEFLEARAKANELKNGPMFGDRQFLLFTTLYAVADTEDAQFVDLAAKLLDDPIPKVRAYAQHTLLCIGDGNPQKRPEILKLLTAHSWNPTPYQSKDHDWVPTDR
ncbi:MAG: hypothetical protein H6822_25480 [Planctomycetaceae bacterium]|nr:hypothetical protein [Planctomycetaceae bacterium]